MPKLTQQMKDLIASQQCYVATVTADGTPNVGPKRSTRVLDEEHLCFVEGTGKLTWLNVQRGSTLAIAVADREKLTGFRFVGKAELVTSGELYDQAVAQAKQRSMPAPKAVVKMKVEKIFNLGMPGAGELIG